MSGLELLKTAINEGVKVLPINFLKDNNIKAKYLGISDKCFADTTCGRARVYLIEEEGELKDKIVYQDTSN